MNDGSLKIYPEENLFSDLVISMVKNGEVNGDEVTILKNGELNEEEVIDFINDRACSL
jgi:hypothetical protein